MRDAHHQTLNLLEDQIFRITNSGLSFRKPEKTTTRYRDDPDDRFR